MSVANDANTRRPIFSSIFLNFMQKLLFKFIGIFIFLLGFMLSLIMFSYDARDPSFRSSNSDNINNLLGSFGSNIADPLHLSLGTSYLVIIFILGIWSWRLICDVNKNKILSRIFFIPIPIATSSIFLSTYPPSNDWIFSYGLGGIFGDTILIFILENTRFGLNETLRITSFFFGILSLFFICSISAINKTEFYKIINILFLSLMDGIKLIIKLINRLVKSQKILKISNYPINDGNKKIKIEPILSNQNQYFNEEDEPTSIRGPYQEQDFKNNDTFQQSFDDDLTSESKDSSVSYFSKVQYPNKKTDIKSKRAKQEEQPSLALFQDKIEDYSIPKLSLLQNTVSSNKNILSDDALNENARMLENVLDDYGVRGEILSVKPGPVVTLYELEPAAGLKASRVISLADDIARSMSALATRVSTIPGRSVIGIELPNDFTEKVLLREILSSKAYGDSNYQLPLALGKNIGGEPIVANLARMPHLLIAGTTGSGKSVGINTMILSLLYKLSPDQCKLIMIDPKMLELSVYDGIPHLLSPVVTDPKKAVVALKWAVAEMEERYRKMSKMGVRNIESFNLRVQEAIKNNENFTRTVQIGFEEETGEPKFEEQSIKPEYLPFIVIIVDEMADLMMVAGKDIEACIQRLAQMARAAGIHLIMATQRPSVDVITGTIKANFPTRISFQVTSKIDSRTILGEMGAEQLLGMGDMLYMANGGKITRVHGPYVSDEEVEEVVNHLKKQGNPEYVSGIISGPDEETQNRIDKSMGLSPSDSNSENALYDQAVAIVARDKKCSTSYIQRRLSIGYNKAAKIVEAMEEQGVVSSANHVGKREILISEI
ncbi:MAG: DNA translocase FtsK [Paracoccaceae bacterium]